MERKGDKAAFEEFDKQILDLLAAMDEAVGRNTLVVATQTYEAVIEVLDTLSKLSRKVDELLQQQQRLDDYIRLEIQPPPMLVRSHLQFKTAVTNLEKQIEATAEREQRRPIAVSDAWGEGNGDDQVREDESPAAPYGLHGVTTSPAPSACTRRSVDKQGGTDGQQLTASRRGRLDGAWGGESCGTAREAVPERRSFGSSRTHANLNYFLKLIEPAIKMVIGGGSSTTDVASCLNQLLDEGDSSGCISAELSLLCVETLRARKPSFARGGNAARVTSARRRRSCRNLAISFSRETRLRLISFGSRC